MAEASGISWTDATGDERIVVLIGQGRLRVDFDSGEVFAPKSNTPLKPAGARTAKGYLRVCLHVDGRQSHFMAHRVVWVAANGPLQPGWEVDHRNRCKTDNRLSNLEAVPGLENMRRAKEAGAFKHVGRRDGIRDSKGRFGRKGDNLPAVRA